MSEPLVTRPAVEIAVQHLLVYGDTDLYPPAFELQYLADNLDRLVPTVAEIENSAITTGLISDLGIARDTFYSENLRPRVAAQLPVLLAIFSTVHAYSLVSRFDSFWGNAAHKAVFSYRPNLSRPEELFDRDVGWKDFVRRQEELAENLPWKISIDLAQFYASVKSQHIERISAHLPLEIEDQVLMRFFFNSVGGSLHGLPVGGDYSRVIGELILSEIDTFALDRGWQYCRFVDDLRIFFPSEEDARTAVYHFIDFVSQCGLQINPAKFHLEQEIRPQNRTLNLGLKNQEQADGTWVDSFFDPYSELVITRIEELKHVSAVKSLKQLIELELEKVVPDIRSLKMYVSALHYSSQSEIEICYPLLVRQVTNVHYFPILPKLVRLTIAIKSAMDSDLTRVLARELMENLVRLYPKLPSSVVGQVCRMISELAETIDRAFFDFCFGLLMEQTGSIFVRREIVQLIRLRPEEVNSEVMQRIENDPVLMNVWDPSRLLR